MRDNVRGDVCVALYMINNMHADFKPIKQIHLVICGLILYVKGSSTRSSCVTECSIMDVIIDNQETTIDNLPSPF